MEVKFDDNGLIARLEATETILAREWDAESAIAINTTARLMAREPAERPGQTYVRTHEYSNEWLRTPIIKRGRFGRVLQNNMPYAGVVGGPPDAGKGKRQAWMHAGRWKRIDEALKIARAEEAGERTARSVARKIEGR